MQRGTYSCCKGAVGLWHKDCSLEERTRLVRGGRVNPMVHGAGLELAKATGPGQEVPGQGERGLRARLGLKTGLCGGVAVTG